MGKKTPAPPPSPDFAGAAQQTADGNLEMAKYQTEANRINQETPWGSLTYTQDPQGAWTQTENLTPDAQRALDSQLGVQQGLSDQANSMLDTVKNSYNQPFNASDWNSYLSGVGGVDTSKIGTAGNFSSNATVNPNVNLSGVNLVDQSKQQNMNDFSSNARVNTNINGALQGTQALNQNLGYFGGNGNGVNVNAPQFDQGRQDEYAKAAYEAQMGLMRTDLANQDTQTNNRLALQGLNPGSEASDNALGVYNDSRSRQLNSLANQSVLTGNQMNQNDYASQLAGFSAGNQAVGQQFGQNLAGYTTNRDSRVAENAARGQQFSQALQKFTTGNDAQAQKFGMDSNTFANTMAARQNNQAMTQAANQAQQQAYNQAMGTAQFKNDTNLQQFGMDQATYDNQLKALQMNSGLQQNYNQAQNQQYGQALQNYGTNWQQEQTLRNMPLNELNALLTGQQVANPQFETYNPQQYVGGADMTGAANSQGVWDTNIYNQQAANANSQNQLLGSVLGAGASMFKFGK